MDLSGGTTANPSFIIRLFASCQQALLEPIRQARQPSKRDGDPSFLVQWEPWWPTLLRNLADLARDSFHSPEPLPLTSSPANFWPDVFVERRFPWKSFFRSCFWHAAAALLLIGVPWPQSRLGVRDIYQHTAITYYRVSDYLPPIASPEPGPEKKTGDRPSRKAEPALASQTIISVPPEPDNSEQTIVNPPHPKLLQNHADLPNLALDAPILPAPPVAALKQLRINAPKLQVAPVQPAPEVRNPQQAQMPTLPTPDVVQPAPAPDALANKLSEIKIANVTPEVEAPKLPVAEQQTTNAAKLAKPPVPSPPSTAGASAASQGSGKLIALNLHPSPPEKIEVPDASRHGSFAAGPAGSNDAPGTPGSSETINKNTDAGSPVSHAPGTGSPISAPNGSGITVSVPQTAPGVGAPKAVVAPSSVPSTKEPENPTLSSSAQPTDVPRRQPPGDITGVDRKIEDKIFSGKWYGTIRINMANLTSAGGSWIISFAELKGGGLPGDLTAPVVLQKTDPKYPPDLIRDRVEGEVTLHAVIRADGTVGDIQVLEGFDEQLNENARTALATWRFRPAMRNGAPVDLEAVVKIPFKLKKLPY